MEASLKAKFVNMTRGTKMITEIIKGGSFNEMNKSLILSLLKFHPHAEEKRVDQIRDIYIGESCYRRPVLMVKYTDSTENDISYKQCLQNLFGKYVEEKNDDLKVKRALRQAAKETTKYKDFLRNYTHLNSDGEWYGKCALCNCETTSKDVDHDEPWPFQKIFDTFIKSTGINTSNIILSEPSPLQYLIVDEDVRQSWTVYHDERCVYRLLCAPCNRRIGAHGYRSE